MNDLTKELGTAKKAAAIFHTAEKRTHGALHTALAGAYKFYDAGNAVPVIMQHLLRSAGLSPTKASHESNQIIKLIFYPEPEVHFEKRQVISKWAIVLRELELVGIKPGDARAYIADRTIDGLVQAYRNRPLSGATPTTKAQTKFQAGKRVAENMPSLGKFPTGGSFPDGLGLALIEFDGTQAIIKRVVADENDKATEKFTRGLLHEFPIDAGGFLPLGLLNKMAATVLSGKDIVLSAVISNTVGGCTARIALDGNLKTVLARGFFKRIANLPNGDYHLDGDGLTILGRLLPKHRDETWTVSKAANSGACIEIDTGAEFEINLTKYNPSTKLASLSSSAKGALSIPVPGSKFLHKLSDAEALAYDSFPKPRKGQTGKKKIKRPTTLTHTLSAGSWKTAGSNVYELSLGFPQKLPSGTPSVSIELKADNLKRIAKASKAVTSIYKKAQPSLLIGNGYLALKVVDAHAGQWELIVPQHIGGDYDDALMTDKGVVQARLT